MSTLLKCSRGIIVKHINIFVLIFNLIFVINVSGQEDQLRLSSLGSCNLSFEDETNQISIYDFGNNPAGIVADQRVPWMRAISWSDYRRGDFRREMDPASRFQLHLQAEAVKLMSDKKSAFRGFIQYYTEDLRDVYRALEYEPYHDNFTSIDTTTGTFDYYGPQLGFEYGKQVNRFLSVGARIRYRLQDGLKREPTKTKIDGRMIYGDIGAMINLPRKMMLGLVFRPFTEQFRLNANKSFLLDYPIIYKYFGDSLLVKNEKVSTYNRKIADEGYTTDAQLIVPVNSATTISAKGGIFLQERQISENTSEGRRDIDDYGSVQKNGQFFEIIGELHLSALPIFFAASYSWNSWDSWARTPRYQTVFEEMNGEDREAGIGVGFDRKNFPLKLGVEYYFRNHKEEKHNYYQHYQWQRDINANRLHFGAEYFVVQNFWLRAGLIDGEIVPEYHLSMEEISVRQISGGIGFTFQGLLLDVAGYYQKSTPLSGEKKRENFFFIFQITQLL